MRAGRLQLGSCARPPGRAARHVATAVGTQFTVTRPDSSLGRATIGETHPGLLPSRHAAPCCEAGPVAARGRAMQRKADGRTDGAPPHGLLVRRARLSTRVAKLNTTPRRAVLHADNVSVAGSCGSVEASPAAARVRRRGPRPTGPARGALTVHAVKYAYARALGIIWSVMVLYPALQPPASSTLAASVLCAHDSAVVSSMIACPSRPLVVMPAVSGSGIQVSCVMMSQKEMGRGRVAFSSCS